MRKEERRSKDANFVETPSQKRGEERKTIGPGKKGDAKGKKKGYKKRIFTKGGRKKLHSAGGLIRSLPDDELDGTEKVGTIAEGGGENQEAGDASIL